jgi:hypothetical protein
MNGVVECDKMKFEVECNITSGSLEVKIARHQTSLTIWWGNYVSILQAKCDTMKTCYLSSHSI